MREDALFGAELQRGIQMKKAYADVLTWLAARLNEGSTYRGMTWILTAFGIALNPDHMAVIVAFGSALAGLIGIICPEAKQQTK